MSMDQNHLSEHIEKILTAGSLAPSGDNLQPWRFAVSHDCNEIKIYLSDEGKDSVYDYKRLASIFAIGAVLENMSVEARSLGMDADMTLFPEGDRECIAEVKFDCAEFYDEENDCQELHQAIFARTTNRKAYRRDSLTDDEKEHIVLVPEKLAVQSKVKILDDRGQIKQVAKLLSYNDILIFKNQLVHDGLYHYFRWTQKDFVEKKSGLYVKTLELSWVKWLGLWLLKSWPMAKIMSFSGAFFVIAKMSERVYVQSGALCAITMPANSRKSFLEGGRVFERVWLEATKMGLSIQPQFGFVAFGQREASGEMTVFPHSETVHIRKKLDSLKKLFQVGEDSVVMIFRIGKSEPPSAISIKRPIKQSMKAS